jgi:hypothetical protein
MYVEPLSSPEIKHNFYKLKDQFNLFNPDCPDCKTESCKTNDFEYEIIDGNVTTTTTYNPVTTTTTNF